MENDIEIDLYAQYMYKYLFPRRIGIPETQQIARKEDLFTIDVGKAVLMTCYEYQEKLQKKFQRDYPKFAKDLCHFMRYSADIGFALYDEDEDDIFESLFLLTAMILELATFCQVQGYETLRYYSDICWAEIFKNHFKDNFFEKGGWPALLYKSQRKAKLYDTTNHFIYEASGKMSKSIHWLTRFDRKIEKSATIFENSNSSTSGDTGGVPYEIPKGELFDIIKAATEMGQKLSEGESFTRFFSVKKSAAPVRQAQSDIKPPVKNTSAKSLGAIPKTRKKLQDNSKKLGEESNSTLLQKFKVLLLGDEDEVAKQLYDVIDNDENVKLLINDKHFLRQIEETAVDMNNKPRYQKILENSLRILSQNSTEACHFIDDSIPKEISSLRGNENTSFMNTATETEQSLDQAKAKEFNTSENTLELTNVIQTVSGTSENDQSRSPKIADAFNTEFNLKIDFNFTKEQIQNEFPSSNTAPKESKVDEQINKIMEAFKSLDMEDADKDRQHLPDDYFKLQELVKAEQIKMAKMMIRQSLGINIIETNNLIQMAKIFTAERNSRIHDVIVFCLMENSRANRIGRQILKLAASDEIHSLYPDEPQISEISEKPAIKEDIATLTISNEVKKPIASTQSGQAKDEFSIEEAKKAAIKLVIAHRRSKKLLTYLNALIDKIKSTRTSKVNIAEHSIPSTPNLKSSFMEILPNDPVVTNNQERNSVSKSPASSPDRKNKHSPKKLNRIYTDSSDSPTSNDSLHGMTSRTVSPEAEDASTTSKNLQASSSSARPSTKFSPKHEVKIPQQKDPSTLYVDARQEIYYSSSGEELFHDASTEWPSDRDEKPQNQLSPIKNVVHIEKTSGKKKKRKKNKKKR